MNNIKYDNKYICIKRKRDDIDNEQIIGSLYKMNMKENNNEWIINSNNDYEEYK
jgi:hypothetical protein